MDSKIFNLTTNGLELSFEFFTRDYIIKTLKELHMDFVILSLDDNYRKKLKDIAHNENKEKYHFLSFIRFFDEDGKQYRIVGGKTTYLHPDIHPRNERKIEKRYSRLFIKEKNRKWHNEVIIINHQENLDRDADERQALFIECFIQRKFNLFDS